MAALDTRVSSLRTVVLIFTAHNLINSCLFSAWNPLRCVYWCVSVDVCVLSVMLSLFPYRIIYRNHFELSEDESWICDWLAYSHLHVSVLVVCMASTQSPNLDSKLAYLCCAIIIVHLAEGIFSFHILNKSIAALQCIVYTFFLCAVFLLDERVPFYCPKTSGSLDKRRNLPIASLALVMQLVVAIIQLIYMTFGSGRDVYSPVYQSMENMQTCNIMIVAMIKLFCLRFCTPEQHMIVNRGQAIMLCISLINLSNAQRMESQAHKVACTFIFTLVLVALAGSM